jgi:preprotein translocase subunit SecB
MSESANQPHGGTPAESPAGPQTAPLVVNVQYVKDLSFEVPDAPAVYARLRQAPRVDINLDVQARRLGEGQNTFEVTLTVRADATEPTGNGAGGAATGGARVFLAELSYAGVFTLHGLPENAVEPVLLVECPRLLFPFARNVLAEVTREGGFPPVLLQPIDFVALWQARRAQAAAQQAQPTIHA